MNPTIRVALVVGAALLFLVPGVLVLTYPGWNDNYYMAVGITAAIYGLALAWAAAYPG